MSSVRDQQRCIAESARLFAGQVPAAVIERIAADVQDHRTEGWSGIAHPHYRTLAAHFVRRWTEEAPDVCADAVAVALLTAAACAQTSLDRECVELVWTGPDVKAIPVRQTEQALLQVMNAATSRLTIVSYAVYKIPQVREALVAAAGRGVVLRIILENPDRMAGQNTYNTLRALGEEVAALARVYVWPQEKRVPNPEGRVGSLHAKCAVADGRYLFVSSANLTEYAFTVNMELGLLITGGAVPGQVESHFDKLIAMGVLA